VVRPKKFLGQHFLKNESICARIADSLKPEGKYTRTLEIGPGTGALTKFLLAREDLDLVVVELDRDSVPYLNQHFADLKGRIVEGDFLHLDLDTFGDGPMAIVGNFPYNISSQILFKVLDNKERVPEVVGMFQDEVAKRLCSGPGNRDYGILSVLLQAFYTLEYLFQVDASEFNPPPKVQSAVIRLVRNDTLDLGCDVREFKKIVKMAFNQRRKTMRNSLKTLIELKGLDKSLDVFSRRPEQLGVEEFVELTKLLT
jgi:16S rRNA (adenine1518-N6/adenine1519-N6)-dimethyltransferase